MAIKDVEGRHFLLRRLVALSMFALLPWTRMPVPRWTQLAPPYVIGTVAMFWLIQRVAAF